VNAPNLPGLRIYVPPEQGARYVLGADPAGGNPTSDDSAAIVLSEEKGEESACLRGKFEPGVFAIYLDQLGMYFNRAGVMCELNNHGAAVLLGLSEWSKLPLLKGNGMVTGWMTSAQSKALLYDTASEVLRSKGCIIHSLDVYLQLCSIEGGTMRAPPGMMDDLAMAFVLAVAALVRPQKKKVGGMMIFDIPIRR
jgi:hypothetical protein